MLITAEPSWHRRARRARQSARAVIAVTQARELLARHHGGGGPATADSSGLMGRGRWSRDDAGWQSRRGRSASRGRGRWGETSGRVGQKRNERDGDAQQTQKEVDRLRKELEDVRRRNAQQPVAHPNAKEGPDRDGDWICEACTFSTNRAARSHCFRCAAPKGFSFPLGSRHAPPVLAGGASFTAGTVAAPPTYAAAVQSSTSPSHHPATGVPSGAASTWLPASSPPAPTFIVPGFASAAPSAAAAHAATVSPPQGAAAVKPLKGKLDALLEARATLAANASCTEALAAIDAQIHRARVDLAHAQPLEVALRGTLGAVANARQAMQRAESKASKLEQQVVAAASAYEAAAAEAATCRKQLADAEAATARTAGGHVDLQHFLGADPGAAWATFRAACEARCLPGASGVDDGLRNRAAVAMAEMQAVCARLPGQPPVPVPSPTSGSVNGLATFASAPPQPAAPLPTPPAAPPPSAGTHAAPPYDAGAVAAAAITASLDQQKQQLLRQHNSRGVDAGPPVPPSPLLNPSSELVPSQFEAVVAAVASAPPPHPVPTSPRTEPAEVIPPLPDPERAALQAQMGAAEKEAKSQEAIAAFTAHYKAQQEHAAAAMALVQGGAAAAPPPPPPAPPAPPAAPEPAAGGEADPIDTGSGRDASAGGVSREPTAKSDDAMGGGADDTIVGKRPIAAIQTARAIAAKAKAKV